MQITMFQTNMLLISSGLQLPPISVTSDVHTQNEQVPHHFLHPWT